jgi:hypothetical protein
LGTISAKTTDGDLIVNSTNSATFISKNTIPSAFTFIKPTNNSIVSYVNKKLNIEYSPHSLTDADGDTLTTILQLYGLKLVTLIKTKGNTGIVYIDSAKFQSNNSYILKGVITDGIDTVNTTTLLKLITCTSH